MNAGPMGGPGAVTISLPVRRFRSMRDGAHRLKAWLAARRRHPPIGTKFTVRAFARVIGVAPATVYSWLRRDTSPSTKHAIKLAEITNDEVPVISWRDSE